MLQFLSTASFAKNWKISSPRVMRVAEVLIPTSVPGPPAACARDPKGLIFAMGDSACVPCGRSQRASHRPRGITSLDGFRNLSSVGIDIIDCKPTPQDVANQL